MALAVVAGVVAFLAVRSRSNSQQKFDQQRSPPQSTTSSPSLKPEPSTENVGTTQRTPDVISKKSEQTVPPVPAVPLAGAGAPPVSEDSVPSKSRCSYFFCP